MKTYVLAGAALMLASAALAAPTKTADKSKTPKAAATPTMVHCAVMTQRSVNVQKATAAKMFADYKGNRYFFCCGGCPTMFKKDPAKYSKNPHIPIPKKG